jgi:hypothetical protein
MAIIITPIPLLPRLLHRLPPNALPRLKIRSKTNRTSFMDNYHHRFYISGIINQFRNGRYSQFFYRSWYQLSYHPTLYLPKIIHGWQNEITILSNTSSYVFHWCIIGSFEFHVYPQLEDCSRCFYAGSLYLTSTI